MTALEREADAMTTRPLTGSGVGITGVNAEAGFATHNVLSSIAVELGIIPAILTMGFLAILFRASWRLIRFAKFSPADRPLVYGLIGLLIVAFVGDMASGRMEGGYGFFAWGMPVYFVGRYLGAGACQCPANDVIESGRQD